MFWDFGYSNNQILVKKDSRVDDIYFNEHYVRSVKEKVLVLGDSVLCTKINLGDGLSPSCGLMWIHNELLKDSVTGLILQRL